MKVNITAHTERGTFESVVCKADTDEITKIIAEVVNARTGYLRLRRNIAPDHTVALFIPGEIASRSVFVLEERPD